MIRISPLVSLRLSNTNPKILSVFPSNTLTHTIPQQKKHLSKHEPVLPLELKSAQNPNIFFDSFKSTLSAFKTTTRVTEAEGWKYYLAAPGRRCWMEEDKADPSAI